MVLASFRCCELAHTVRFLPALFWRPLWLFLSCCRERRLVIDRHWDECWNRFARYCERLHASLWITVFRLVLMKAIWLR